MFLRALSLFYGSIFLLYVLTGFFLMFFTSDKSPQSRQGLQGNDFTVVIFIGLFMMLLNILVWPVHRLFSKEDAWWARGWWPLFFYTVIGVGLLLVGWFL